MSTYVDSVYTQGLNPSSLELGNELTSRVHELVEKDEKLYSFFRNLNEIDPKSYTHAFLVSLYATATTRNFDWQAPKTLESVAMASMFHDIGKTKLPESITNKSEEEMTDEELLAYQEHPNLSFEILEGCKGVSNSVCQMVLQHHEAYDGSGYPRGVKGSKILLVANIICLVDDFVHLMENQGVGPIDTAKMILQNEDMLRMYNGLVIENFIKVFSNPSKIKKDARSANLDNAARKLSS